MRENDLRLELRASKKFLDLIDNWRAKQRPVLSRAQAIRDLVSLGASKAK